jgi:hypothetical protein
MSARVVPERLDERVLFQDALHDAALHTLAATVHDPQLAQSFRVGRSHVLLDHRGDLPRQERVQVELRADREIDWFIHESWSQSHHQEHVSKCGGRLLAGPAGPPEGGPHAVILKRALI